MIFGVLNPEKIWRQQLVHLPTSPVYCSHFTLGNPKKVIFQQYYPYIHIIYVISVENKLLPLYPPHLKNVTPLPCKMHNIFIWLKVCGSSKSWWIWNEPVVGWHWWLWKELVVMCGKWNVRQATLQQMLKVTTFCTNTCFQSFLPLINCIIHHALLKFNPCCNKTLLFRNSSV